MNMKTPSSRPLLLLLFFLTLLPHCARREFAYRRFLVGGPCSVTFDITNLGLASHLYNEIDNALVRYDSLLSYFSEKSLVSEINTRHRAKLESEITGLFHLCDSISRLTSGRFDISIAPLMKVWGFYDGKTVVPDSALILRARQRVDFRRIVLRNDSIFTPEDMQIDLGGIAQGWVADRIAGLLKGYGVKAAVIDIGGEVVCVGRSPAGRPWRVGIRHPRGEGVIETLEICDGALSTSGDYEKFFIVGDRRYPHIIDPRTGEPARDFVSVTIIGPDAAFCDGLATAVCVMGTETGMKFLDSLRIRGILYHEIDGRLQRLETQ